jgi:sensor histidine kinase YesM
LHGDFRKALEYYHEAYSLYEEIGNKRKLLELLEDISEANYAAGDYQRTIEYGEKTMVLGAEKNQDGSHVASNYEMALLKGVLGITYREYGDFEKSISYMKEYLGYSSQYGSPPVEHSMFLNCVGHVYFLQGNLDSSVVYLKKAGYINGDDPPLVAMKTGAIFLLGNIYLRSGDYNTAMKYFQDALRVYRGFGHLDMMAITTVQIGNAYRATGDVPKAKKYFLEAWNLAQKMRLSGSIYASDSITELPFRGVQLFKKFNDTDIRNFILSTSIMVNQALSDFYLDMGDSARSYAYFMQYSVVKDTLEKLIKDIELQDLQSRYESERNKHQIVLLSTENELQLSRLKQNRYLFATLGGVMLIIILLSLMFIRQNKIKNEQKAVTLEQKLLRSQMNPHFIFNSLASIQNKIINEEPDLASDYLARFSMLFRNILDGSVEEFIPLKKEIETVENYLALQKIRFPDKFDYVIDIDTGIDIESVMIPPMLAQPFIENSIEHGIKHKEGKGRIDIRCRRSNDVAMFEVEDDGIGRERARDLLLKQEESHKSLATVITRERIAALNRKSKKKITLEIVDLTDDLGQASGTLVRFVIPLA